MLFKCWPKLYVTFVFKIEFGRDLVFAVLLMLSCLCLDKTFADQVWRNAALVVVYLVTFGCSVGLVVSLTLGGHGGWSRVWYGPLV